MPRSLESRGVPLPRPRRPAFREGRLVVGAIALAVLVILPGATLGAGPPGSAAGSKCEGPSPSGIRATCAVYLFGGLTVSGAPAGGATFCPGAVGLVPFRSLIFVGGEGCGTTAVTVYRSADGALVGSIPLNGYVVGFTFDTARDETFIESTNGTGVYPGATVTVVNDSTLAAVATVPLGAGPSTRPTGPGCVVPAGGADDIWLPNATSAVAVSDATNSVVAQIALNAPVSNRSGGAFLGGIACDTSTARLFATAGSGSAMVFVIASLANDTVLARIPETTSVEPQIVYDPSSDRVFGYFYGYGTASGGLVAYSPRNGSVLATLGGGYEGYPPSNPVALAEDESDSAIVVSTGNGNGASDTIYNPTTLQPRGGGSAFRSGDGVASDAARGLIVQTTAATENNTGEYLGRVGYLVLENLTTGNSTNLLTGVDPATAAFDSGRGVLVVGDNQTGRLSLVGGSPTTALRKLPYGLPDGNPITSIAYDPGDGRVFVAGLFPYTVSVLSDSNWQLEGSLSRPGGDEFRYLVFDPVRDELFASSYDSKLYIYSGATLQIEGTVALPAAADALGLDPALGDVLSVAPGCNGFNCPVGPGSLTLVSESTDAVVATLSMPNGADAVAYAEGFDEIFVASASAFTPTTSLLTVVSDRSNSVVRSIPIGLGASGVAYDPVDRQVLATSFSASNLTLVSPGTNSVVETIRVGYGPSSVVVDPANATAYVTNLLSGSVTTLALGAGSGSIAGGTTVPLWVVGSAVGGGAVAAIAGLGVYRRRARNPTPGKR